MSNIVNLHVVYDSSGLITGLSPIDLVAGATGNNKIIGYGIYDISQNPPIKVSGVINNNTKSLTKIDNGDGSYYLVSELYGIVSGKLVSDCEFCKQTPWECNCDGDSENIPKVISLSLSDIGATSWDDDIKTLLAQHINSLGLDIKGTELYFFEVEGDDGNPSSSDVVTDVSISMTTNSELSLSTTGANGQTEVTVIPLNPLEQNNW